MPDASTNKTEGKFETTVTATDPYSEEPQDITSGMKHTSGQLQPNVAT